MLSNLDLYEKRLKEFLPITFEVVISENPSRIIVYEVYFSFTVSSYRCFTLAHGWVQYLADGKRVLKRKLAGIAYLHPDHTDELKISTGVLKSFEHLVYNEVGEGKLYRDKRKKVWDAFMKEFSCIMEHVND